MNKRPEIDWNGLTADTAEPMPEATQRAAHVAPASTVPSKPSMTKPRLTSPIEEAEDISAQINIKVPQDFKMRFARAALDAGMKHNKFLNALLNMWEGRKVER